MIANLLATAAIAFAPNLLTKVEVQILTGDDDLRGDSRAAVQVDYSHASRQAKPLISSGGIAAGVEKTAVFIPVAGSKLENLQRMRLMFISGRSTGFDDHWKVQQIRVYATIDGSRRIVFNQTNLGMHLLYTQNYISPLFSTAVSKETISPSDIWAELEDGSDDARANSEMRLDIESVDGRSWRGMRSFEQMRIGRTPGVSVVSVAGERMSLHDLRSLRLQFNGGRIPEDRIGASTDAGDDYIMRGVRFYYRGADGSKKELSTYNEINHRFAKGGWWQAPILRPFNRVPGVLMTDFLVEVWSGADDLRRMSPFANGENPYSSKVDITFNIPTLSPRRYPAWFMNGDYVRSRLRGGTSWVEQADDEFPEGWTGSYHQYGKFSKLHRISGTPIFLSSDLFDVQVKFIQGRGGNLLPTQSSGGGLIGDLRRADNWDLQGIAISAGSANTPMRRIYSDYGINRRMDRDGQIFRSRQFETARLRALPKVK